MGYNKGRLRNHADVFLGYPTLALREEGMKGGLEGASSCAQFMEPSGTNGGSSQFILFYGGFHRQEGMFLLTPDCH